jgi:chromosome segregation ATPase
VTLPPKHREWLETLANGASSESHRHRDAIRAVLAEVDARGKTIVELRADAFEILNLLARAEAQLEAAKDERDALWADLDAHITRNVELHHEATSLRAQAEAVARERDEAVAAAQLTERLTRDHCLGMQRIDDERDQAIRERDAAFVRADAAVALVRDCRDRLGRTCEPDLDARIDALLDGKGGQP